MGNLPHNPPEERFDSVRGAGYYPLVAMFPRSSIRRACSRQTLWILAVIVLLTATLQAAPVIHPHAKQKQEIEQLEERWRQVQVSGDVSEMDKLMSEDFIGISMTGQANTKTQQLDRYRNRHLIITEMKLSDRKIKIVGAVAIVTALAEVEGTNEGEPLHGRYRYTRVYQRISPGVWKTTNFEVTKIPANRH